MPNKTQDRKERSDKGKKRGPYKKRGQKPMSDGFVPKNEYQRRHRQRLLNKGVKSSRK